VHGTVLVVHTDKEREVTELRVDENFDFKGPDKAASQR